ncbi:MAG: hypothetical protein OJF59_002818 [Cytophagales bacterium]|jgi:hypothetical protein|nr:hypothetical protein [Bacteroidota bacterium]WHZ09063.1 MAG: hypothetical protein OJF59_002818 [Cytophagales bacterium]
MRTTGELEKKIIDEICSSEQTSIAALLCNNIPGLNLKIDNTENTPLSNEHPVKVELVIPDDDKLNETAFEQTKGVLYILNFLKYLEEQGYAISGYFAHGRVAHGYMSNTPNFAGELKSVKIRYTHFRFPDERTREFIFAYADRLIIPTHHLNAFRENRYRTAEDVKHQEMKTITWIATIVAVILGILSIIF